MDSQLFSPAVDTLMEDYLEVTLCGNGEDFDTIYLCAGSLKKKKRACPGNQYRLIRN